MNLMKHRRLTALCLPLLMLSACQREIPVEWVDGPGHIIEPPNACDVWGAWRKGPSTLTEDRTVVEFVTMDVGFPTQSVQGYRFEVDCATSRYRLIGQAQYGQISQQDPLGERYPGTDLSQLNTELKKGPLAPQIAEACRLDTSRQSPDFASLNEFVEATGRIGETYFAGKQCIFVPHKSGG